MWYSIQFVSTLHSLKCILTDLISYNYQYNGIRGRIGTQLLHSVTVSTVYPLHHQMQSQNIYKYDWSVITSYHTRHRGDPVITWAIKLLLVLQSYDLHLFHSSSTANNCSTQQLLTTAHNPACMVHIFNILL